jgi:hypothetical protein
MYGMVWYGMGMGMVWGFFWYCSFNVTNRSTPGDIGDNVPANGSRIMDVWMPVPSDGPIPFGLGSPSCPCQGEFSNEEVRQVKVVVKCSIHPAQKGRVARYLEVHVQN